MTTYLDTAQLAAQDRRGNKPAVPPNLASVLNQLQTLALQKIENFGWQLAFIRRPLFESPIAVVVSPDRMRYAVLEEDGAVNMDHGLVIRH